MKSDRGPRTSTERWTFLSNHAHVLLCIAQHPEVTLREVAERVGITERAVQRIVADLEEGHYLERARSGRRNRYEVHPELPLRHPVESHREVGDLLALILEPGRSAGRRDEAPRPSEGDLGERPPGGDPPPRRHPDRPTGS